MKPAKDTLLTIRCNFDEASFIFDGCAARNLVLSEFARVALRDAMRLQFNRIEIPERKEGTFTQLGVRCSPEDVSRLDKLWQHETLIRSAKLRLALILFAAWVTNKNFSGVGAPPKAVCASQRGRLFLCPDTNQQK